MGLARRVKEIASAIRHARIPEPPEVKPTEFGGTTGEEVLFRSWVREADRRGPPPSSVGDQDPGAASEGS